MSRAVESYSGERFNRWLILDEFIKTPSGRVRWKARCDCGTECFINVYEAKRGRTKSCGCMLRQSNMTTEERKAAAQKAVAKRLKYVDYSGPLGVVVGIVEDENQRKTKSAIYKVRCSKCDGHHFYSAASLKHDTLTRDCPEYRTYNYTGLTKAEIKLRSSYKIEISDLERLQKEQSNCCAIFSKSFDETKRFIDHDHDSGEVRGLLCSSCNSGIGLLGDDLKSVMRAVEYLYEPPFKKLKGGL